MQIPKQRLIPLNSESVKEGKFVLYWMQSSHRTENNWALEYAIQRANELEKPVLVAFGLIKDFPHANARHYQFMLEGLKEASSNLEKMGIKMIVQAKSPSQTIIELSKDARMAIVDRGYLKINRGWYKEASENVPCLLTQIEDNVVVPVEFASPKEEYAARTFRPKITKKIEKFLQLPQHTKPNRESSNLELQTLDIEKTDKIISKLKIKISTEKTEYFQGGTNQANKKLEEFIAYKLDNYDEQRNDPIEDCQSDLSPYLHFGQISPTYVTLSVLNAGHEIDHPFLEQLIVRRELAINYIHYNPNYDSIEGLPEWAKNTLRNHKSDPREYTYTYKELEYAKTHDPYWNAAQNQMRKTGKMHSYMRMYWGKKIMEWTRTPKEAFEYAIRLNDEYELDGRDPNGYTGVAWCLGKHDQPWKERPIFGKTRYMNAKGLQRKFDIEKYAYRWNSQVITGD